MDFISECFDKHNQTFRKKLKSAGYSAEQIALFLPEVAAGMKAAVQKTAADDLITGLMSDGPAQLLNSIDVDAMSIKLGMNPGQIIIGVNAITPMLSQAFTQSSNGLVSAAATLAWDSTDHG
ncbi:MAG: hypothetical protein WBN96_06970 [Gammaproteobacteria bacterium]